jgi:hypothetical protein
MALVKRTRCDYLALICTRLAPNSWCHNTRCCSMVLVSLISLFNYRTNSSYARCLSWSYGVINELKWYVSFVGMREHIWQAPTNTSQGYLPITQTTGRVVYLPCSGYYAMPLILATRCVVYYARCSGVRLLLLCGRNVVTYTHHQNDKYVTLCAGFAVMQLPCIQCLAMFMPFFGR